MPREAASPPSDAFDVAVVGAGPAGQMAAIAAAERGRRVVLLEQMPRPGLKLLASGGGRANLTHLADPAAFFEAFGRRGRFIAPALEALDPPGLRQFLDGLGVPTVVEADGRVFPASHRAADVQVALGRRLTALGVEVRLRSRAVRLWLDGDRVRGIETRHLAPRRHVAIPRGESPDLVIPRGGSPDPPRLEGDSGHGAARTGRAASGAAGDASRVVRLAADGVVLACGGRSWPGLGGTGGGYALARQAGHTLVAPVPGLVPLVVREPWPARLAGVALAGARVWIDRPAFRKAGVTGDVLFTHRGVSGPAVLDLSASVAGLLAEGEPVPVCIEPVAGMDAARWAGLLDGWRTSAGRRHVATLLAERLPASVGRMACELAGVPADTPAVRLPAAGRRGLAERLGRLELSVTGTEGFDVAFVTRGGVSLKEVDPRTLASRRVAGLHVAGELLDLDGPTGGFNLHWAFASGRLAGLAAGNA
ncbi:MAG: aminoacetone oxidase family FAD-binding enzyme [Planctomycetes bacterium]|nr:aminoacetone oxidase family FAD-binding enzyme [Planctomycetota bacterium]